MTLIPSGQNLFVVDVHYLKPVDVIDPERDAHIEFLKENYAAGNFIASGPKVPRNGGIIIATAVSLDALERILVTDPYYKKMLAQYTITEFQPSMVASQLSV